MSAKSRSVLSQAFHAFHLGIRLRFGRRVLRIANSRRPAARLAFGALRLLTRKRVRIMMTPGDLAGAESCRVTTLRDASAGLSHAPRRIGQAARNRACKAPPIHAYLARRARVCLMSSSMALQEPPVVLVDCVDSPDPHLINYVTGHLRRFDPVGAKLELRPCQPVDKGIFLGGNGAGNYYHWLVEILPKLQFLPQLAQYRDHPLLVGQTVRRFPSLMQSLQLFAGDHPVVFLDESQHYLVDSLLYINSPSHLPFNMHDERPMRLEDTCLSAASLDFVREGVLQAARSLDSQPEVGERVILCRRHGRRSYNQDEVLANLTPLGFQPLYTEDYDLLQQAQLMQRVRWIVGPTGAAWTNLLFCRPGTRALCWMAEEYGDFAAFASIAAHVGVDLRYLTFPTAGSSTRELYFRDYVVSTADVMAGLAELDASHELGLDTSAAA